MGLALAVRYCDGKGIERDYAEAMRWARLAADQGDAPAWDFVGWMYFRGIGVPRNADIAANYFKAAAGKSAAAAWNLGQCYFAAQGVEHDIPKALECWKNAACLTNRTRGMSQARCILSPTRRFNGLYWKSVPGNSPPALGANRAEVDDRNIHYIVPFYWGAWCASGP